MKLDALNFLTILVVEWDCDEKELKNSHVSKGLWKITTSKVTPSVSLIVLSICIVNTLNFDLFVFNS